MSCILSKKSQQASFILFKQMRALFFLKQACRCCSFYKQTFVLMLNVEIATDCEKSTGVTRICCGAVVVRCKHDQLNDTLDTGGHLLFYSLHSCFAPSPLTPLTISILSSVCHNPIWFMPCLPLSEVR